VSRTIMLVHDHGLCAGISESRTPASTVPGRTTVLTKRHCPGFQPLDLTRVRGLKARPRWPDRAQCCSRRMKRTDRWKAAVIGQGCAEGPSCV
jgi:hypothetical protein